MKVGDLVRCPGLTVDVVPWFGVVIDVLQEVDEFGFVKDPNDWAYIVLTTHQPALRRKVFECEVEKVS
tara:strand:- start:652 stop:855 length:204 start_codon:yes stop_codon:yes gene_type:complete